jgi:hypothetical protein
VLFGSRGGVLTSKHYPISYSILFIFFPMCTKIIMDMGSDKKTGIAWKKRVNVFN